MELISVIIPIYNVEVYLDRCIESVVDNSYTNLEIILVDDGSPDRCPAMCDAWAKKDNRVKVIHKKNGGQSDARNAGMAIATGEYIAFVDSDDWLDRNYFMKLVELIKFFNADISACKYIEVDDGIARKYGHETETVEIYNTKEALTSLLDGRLYGAIWNKLYRRQLAVAFPFEQYDRHEDEYWTYKIIAKAKTVARSTYRGYYYNHRSNSVMTRPFSLSNLCVVDALSERLTYLDSAFPDLAERERESCFPGNLLWAKGNNEP